MALFTPGAIISEIRGSIANTTFSRSRAGAISKQKLIQTNPNSVAQQAIRALQASAVAAWQSLSQITQDLWISFSSSQLSRPRIDGQHKLSGYNTFIRFHITRNQYGLAGIPDPKPQIPIGSYEDFLFTVTSSSLTLQLRGTNVDPDIMVVSRLSGPLSSGISSVNQSLLIILDFSPAPNGLAVLNLLPAWTARFGSLSLFDGLKIFASLTIVNRLTSQRNILFRSSQIIDAPPLFVAVSSSGIGLRAMTSVNAASWVIRVTAADNNWAAVAHSPEIGLFVAVAITGAGNRVMTSPDGVNWTIRVSAADNAWRSVTWASSLELFCAVADTGAGNRVMTSPDGIAWTIRVSAADNNWRSVAWSPNLALFCAVSISGTTNRVMTSPDGITWTIRVAASGNNWRSVTWAPSLALFCAVANSGASTRVMTSPDGINWTTRASAASNNWVSVAWSPELSLFCSVSVNGSGNRVMTSPDGINWTIRVSAANNAWRSVIWSPSLGLFCAVSDTGSGNRVMTSPDGINWITRVSAADNTWQSIATS